MVHRRCGAIILEALMFDPKKMLDDLLGSNVPGAGGTVRDKLGQAGQMAKDNPLAAGALAAVLLGTGTGRAVTGSALRLGGLAAIATLGYKAYQNYKNGDAPVAQTGEPDLIAPPTDSAFGAETQDNKEFTLILVRAMIAAARADGHITEEEKSKIGDKLAMSGMDREAQDFLANELSAPVDLDALVAAAGTEAQRVELYTASRLTIDPKTRAERGYLDLLAGRLQLPDALVDHIEATVSGATV
jgi:uncharacterized membrane protein YebE (DUF533 family)